MPTNDNEIYYNLNLTNDGLNNAKASVYNILDAPIVIRPQEFELSIVKFQISSDFIPLFFPVIPDPGSPLETNMSITLSYSGVNFRQPVNISLNEAKYGVYNIGIYLQHLNDASEAAFVILKTAYPASDGTKAPLFFLDPVSGLISMYVEDAYLETNVNRIQISVNNYMGALLNLPASVYLGAGNLGGVDQILAVGNNSVLTPVAPRAGYPFAISAYSGNILQVSQEFRCLGNWNNLKAILFTTSTIPVNNEYLPTIYGSGQNSNVNSNTMPILTDFDVLNDDISVTRGRIQYLPTAEYRMISLGGTNPLKAINCDAYYQMLDGSIHDVMLPPGTNLSMKLMFRRKVKV